MTPVDLGRDPIARAIARALRRDAAIQTARNYSRQNVRTVLSRRSRSSGLRM